MFHFSERNKGFNLTALNYLQFIFLRLWTKISEPLAITPTQGFALLTSHSNLLWVKEKGAVGRSLGVELKYCLKTLMLQNPCTHPVQRGTLPLHYSPLCLSSQQKGNWVRRGVREGNVGGGGHSSFPSPYLLISTISVCHVMW